MQKPSQVAQPPVHRRSSRPPLFAFVVSSLLLGLACGCGSAKPAVATNDPGQLLRQMSEKLAQAQKLSFKVDRKLDAALVEGRNIPENAQIEISVSRPDKFLVKSDSPDTARQFVFDGQNLSIYDETMNLYATVPVPGTIDEVMAKINEKYGFTPPLDPFEVTMESQMFARWYGDKLWVMVPAQAIVGQFLMTFKEFPQRQKSASFNIQQVLDQMKAQTD
jgi:outer membrane lipoprotein-sorting protein